LIVGVLLLLLLLLQRPGASARRMEDITAAGENAVAALQAALQRAQLTQAQLEGNAARTADNLNDALAAIDKLQVREGGGSLALCAKHLYRFEKCSFQSTRLANLV
jgi:hypothetical protein